MNFSNWHKFWVDMFDFKSPKKNISKTWKSWTTYLKALASETDQTELINELMAMVTSSLVCADFCKKSAELGGGALAIDFMRTNIEKASSV